MLSSEQLAAAQAIRERAMTDACTIRAPGGTVGEFDSTTGTRPITPSAAHYTGPCRVMDTRAAGSDDVGGDQQVTTQPYLVELPLSVTTAAIEHVVTITASQDPWLVGRELTVTRVRGLTYASSRVLVCTDNLETPSEES